MDRYEIQHYVTENGEDLYINWLEKIKDIKAKIAIVRRIAHLENGNFGDYKFCRDGVFELRIDVGAGYRVYYGLANKQIILLLCGGDKRTQNADIKRACKYWQDWKQESIDEQ